ncbi:hypothetical protein BpHYR1_003092 [Brachionus plicatilis]|uniref:Uncharacterized protein n=1 Tax=Brachionus plicatilis TaxID=10195 RepID=A0A3M7PPD6_BRAPC|nr:hypothetical protein BpHYR1_003092 [Brachionus plicatilis]
MILKIDSLNVENFIIDLLITKQNHIYKRFDSSFPLRKKKDRKMNMIMKTEPNVLRFRSCVKEGLNGLMESHPIWIKTLKAN